MVGFPGIKSIQISGSVVTIERNTGALQENPADNKLRESLAKEVASVSGRPLTDPAVSAIIASAQFALGDKAAAETNVNKALKEAPQLPAALEVKKRIELDRNLAVLTSQVKQNPDDAAVKAKLADSVGEVTSLRIANPETIANVALAQAVLGNQAKAEVNVDKALAINPNFAPAIQLKKQINT